MPVLIQIDAYDPLASAPVTLRAGSHDDPAVCHAVGQLWWPAISKLPTLRYDLFDGAFDAGQITSPSSNLTLQTEPWPSFARYSFADARFQLWTGSGTTWTLRFDGRVSAQPTIENGAAEIQFAVDDRWLDKSLLATYAGTTGAEGPAAMKGVTKPLALGAPRYVAGKLIDSVNSVFQISAYGPINAIEAALERLVRFGAPIGDYPTYAALVAANIPAGRWATANAVGMARFGAPPNGQICFLVQGDIAGPDGWARKPGQHIRRLALLSGGGGKILDASLNALDVARPYNLSIYVDDQTTARQLIQEIATSVNAVAGVTWLGQLFVVPVQASAPVATLRADGSGLPPVSGVRQIETSVPFSKLAIGAARAWTVHAFADIAFTAPLVPLGDYAAGTTYREGNVVQYQGSSWLYVATTPSAGNAPPYPATSNAYWRGFAMAGQNGSNAPLLRVQWSVDGATAWHDNYFGADVYQRQSNDNGATYGPAIRIIGEDGSPGPDGKSYAQVFRRSATVPPTPADFNGNPPSGWSDGPPAGTDILWQSSAQFRAATQLTSWTAPQRITGPQGLNGSTNQVVLSSFAQGLRGFRPGARDIAAYTPATIPTPADRFVADINYPGYFGARQVPYAHFYGTPASGANCDAFWTPSPWGGDTLESGKGYMMPVKQGDVTYSRCLAAQHRCRFDLYILIFTATGSFVEAKQWVGARDLGGQGGDPANFNEVGGIYTVTHPQAAFASLLIRLIGLGQPDPYIFFTEPAMGKLPADQTTMPVYVDGPNDPLADITALNQAFMTQPDPVVIQADYQGNQVPGQFPIQLGIVRRLGGVNVSPGTLYNVGFAGNVAGSINNVAGSADRGLLTITGGSAGTVTVTSGYNESYMTVQFAVSTNYAAAPVSGGTTPPAGGGGGGPSAVSTFAPPGTNTGYTLMATLSAVAAGSAGSVMVSTSLSFSQQLRRPASVATNLLARVTRAVNGGTETEVTTQTSQEPAAKYLEGSEAGNPNGGTVQNEPGSLTLSYNDAGIPAAAAVVYRIYGLADLAANGVNNVQGTFAATPN